MNAIPYFDYKSPLLAILSEQNHRRSQPCVARAVLLPNTADPASSAGEHGNIFSAENLGSVWPLSKPSVR